MAPKKQPKVTSSSTRSARVKGGSNPVVTKGEARTRAARTSLGPAPKQRPMATGGTKGPLQGGTRSPGLKINPSKIEAGPGKVGPSLGQQSTSSSANPRSVRPPSESRIRSMEAGPGKVRAGMGGGTTLSSKPGANAAKAQAAKDATRMANRTAKGYGQPSKVEAGLRQAANIGNKALRTVLDARGALTHAGIAYETLKARPTGSGATLTGQGTVSKFANARDKAMAKAKGIKGSPVLGGKKSAAASFDSAFAAARKAGKSGFTFKGKKYNTKMK